MRYERLDLTGQVFGKLTVIGPDHRDNKRGWWWLCQCECGNTKVIASGNLRSGSTISCGCYKRGQEKYDYVGKKFGRLYVESYAEDQLTPSGRRIIRYNCICDCGNKKVVSAWHLKSGKIVSCGCYKHEREIAANIKHGLHDTPLYSTWSCMKQRCKDMENPLYGGKGIRVCDEWVHDFKAFADWAFANGYDPLLTIDRIDNNKGYSPDNCRWVPAKVQSNNTNRNRYITINGVTKTLSQWCEVMNLKKDSVKARIYKGWNEMDAQKKMKEA